MKEVDLLNMQHIKVILNSIYPLHDRCYFIPAWAHSLKMLPTFIIIWYNKSPDEAKRLLCFLKAIILLNGCLSVSTCTLQFVLITCLMQCLYQYNLYILKSTSGRVIKYF